MSRATLNPRRWSFLFDCAVVATVAAAYVSLIATIR